MGQWPWWPLYRWDRIRYLIEVDLGVETIAGVIEKPNGILETIGFLSGRETPRNWEEFAQCLGVSKRSAEDFLRDWRPRAAKILDEAQEKTQSS